MRLTVFSVEKEHLELFQ